MPIRLPYLDDRNFEQLFEEAKRRIAVHTPEWTNFESDPGITLVQVFAFLTDSLLYRANRIPERNRVKFLQLLGVGLQPAAAADGIIAIRNERGPVESLSLLPGVVVSASNVDFLTRDAVTVLPLEAQVYYKKPIDKNSQRYQDFFTKYEALLVAQRVEQASMDGTMASPTSQPLAQDELDFYETVPLPAPTPSAPTPMVTLSNTTDQADTIDQAVYIALLAPKSVRPEDARIAIANQTLSIGVVPALTGDVSSLQPLQLAARQTPVLSLVYEIVNAREGAPVADWARLPVLQEPDVLTDIGIVQVKLPGESGLQMWSFPEPLTEGTGDFPPRLEDDELRERLVTWIRLRLPTMDDSGPTSASSQALSKGDARLTWVGINAARISQAVPVSNELLGQGNGEPDQAVVVANTPVIKRSVRLFVEDENGFKQLWRLTDDLLAAGENDQVFTLDPESGQIRFGDGLRGARPPAKRRILVSYEYGGGTQGNVGIGAIKASRDVRLLQGGFKVGNPVPTSGGSLGESVAEGERDIPLVLRHHDRLVTVQDFRDITLRTPGVDVGRVEVLPLSIPKNGEEPAPGVVTVMVVPSFDPLHPLWPEPDRLFLRRVCDHLNPRRLVTTEVYVRGPTYVDVYVSVGIQVQGGFFPDKVRQTVRERLNGYLSSLPPGGPLGQGWPLKKWLMGKDLEAVVTRVPGVEFVHNLEMGVDSLVDVPEHEIVGLQLPKLAGLSVQGGWAESIAAVFAPASSTELAEGEAEFALLPVPVVREKC
jgi:hypothetical protein